MDFGYCKDCKYWGMDYTGACAYADYIDDKDKNDPKHFGFQVTADDDQGLDCIVLTGPNFGCVNFQDK